MAFARVSDLSGTIEVVVFPDLLEKNSEIWTKDKIVEISGKVDNRDGNLKIICDTVKELKI